MVIIKTDVSGSDFMTLKEFSERTGVSLSVIYDRVKRGKLGLPARRIGQQWRISRADYARWLDEGSEDAT